MYTQLSAPLDERIEYASTEWLAEVKRFLGARAETVPNATFSFSGHLDNPPPHLANGDGLFGFTVRLRDGTVEVEGRPGADVDLLLRADYNAALPLAWIVYGDDPSSRARIVQEYHHLGGDKAPRQHGQMPADPAVAALMRELHDHLAVRTTNNPDIGHRVKHFGLERQVAELADTGYTVLENAFTDDYARELREETHRNHAGRAADASFRATMLLCRGQIWEEAVVHPWVLTLAEHLLGRGCLSYQSATIVKGPGQETHPGLHSDYAASRVEQPFPDFCLAAPAVWAIDDFRGDAGPTVIMPGSFRKGRQVLPGTTQDGTVRIEMPQGCIAFWHGATWHGSTPRKAPGHRTSLHNAYSRNFMRPIERYDDIDQAIVDRNPPVFSTLCGLDDAFGKSGETGPDFERLGYAARSGYGRSTTA